MNNALDISGFSIWDMGTWFAKFFASLLFTIVQWGCMFVFLMESVFWALARGIKVPVIENGQQKIGPDGKPLTEFKNIVDLLLFDNEGINQSSFATKFFLFILLVGLGLTILMAMISIIRSHISTKDEDHNPSLTIVGVVKAVVLMVAVPFIVYAIMYVTNKVVDGICIYANVGDMTLQQSFANKIFFMFSNVDENTMKSFADSNGNYTFSFTLSEEAFTSYDGSTTWEKLLSSGFVTDVENQGIGGYNFIFAIIILIVLCIALFKAILLLGDRIVDLIVLYIVAPLPIACYPNDDGKRADIWKELIISKIVSALGYVIAFIVYLTLCEELYKQFKKWDSNFTCLKWTLENGQFNQGTILTVIYLLIIVAGGLSVPAVYAMLSQLVGQTAGRVAESDLQNANQDIGHIQRGMSMVGAGIMAAGSIGAKFAFGSGKSGGASGVASKMAVGGMAGSAMAGGASSLLAGAGANGVGGALPHQLKATTAPRRMVLGAGAGIAGGAGYVASHGLIGSVFGGIGGIGNAIGNKIKDGREGKYNDLVNQAVANYDNKDKLGAINKQISKMGGKQVDDNYMAERIKAQEQQQKEAKTNAKLIASKAHTVARLNTHGQEGKRLAKEVTKQKASNLSDAGKIHHQKTNYLAEAKKEIKEHKKAKKGGK